MIVFLLKSSACLAIFLMFYKLFLEKECMHTFKRYYLLVVLVLALVIPSITFTEYVEVIPPTAIIAPVDIISTETAMAVRENTAAQEINQTGIDYWPLVLWTLYGLGVLIFSLKFLLNLQKIARNIRNNPKLKIDSIINVLLRDAIVPHTFLNYIFLNRQKFESHEIPKDVLVHEATHAQQKHSLDVLFVELLQIVFWFNPLLYLTKKSIKLNHEFLADAAVLKQGSLIVDYQNTLLTFASSANYKSNQPSMANAINYSTYSSIKKRFTIMKTQTSKKSILVRSVLILPLLTVLLYGFSARVQLPKEHSNTFVLQEGATKMELSKFNTLAEKYNGQLQENRVIPAGDLQILENIYGKMTQEQRANALPFPECPDPKSSNHKGATVEQTAWYNALIKKTAKKPESQRIYKQIDVERLEHIYNSMSDEQRTDAEAFPKFVPSPNQEGATKKELDQYNSLAKKYNEMLAAKGNIHIKKSEIDRLEYLHGFMTEEQRIKAEPFPDFPEPPEAPVPPAPPNVQDKSEKEAAEVIVQHIIENQDPYDNGTEIRLTSPSAKKNHYVKKDHSMIRTVEEVKNKDEVIDESLVAERAIITTPFWHLNSEKDAEVYLDGKEITYAEMKKMERDGMITSMNITKNPNRTSIIKLNETSFQPPEPPKPQKPKSPLELLEELKKDNVKIILDEMELGYEEAEKLFNESTFSRVNVRKETSGRPVLEVSTD